MKVRILVSLMLLLSIFAAVMVYAQDDEPVDEPAGNFVLPESVFLRAGPGEDYLPVGSLFQGDTVTPLNRNATGDWIMVRHRRGFGWISRNLVVWNVSDLESLPVIEPTNLTPTIPPGRETSTPFFPTNTPSANYVFIEAQSAYVRAGPGRGYLRLGQLLQGETVDPVGRNEDTTWIMIRFERGFAWIAQNLVEWQDEDALENLPVVSLDDLTPSPTFTPSETSEASETPTATLTLTETATPTATETATLTLAPSETATDEPTATVVPTDTVEPSQTPTDEPTTTLAPTETPTDIPTNTVAPSETATDEPTATVVPTDTVEPSQTPTDEPTTTLAPSETPTDESTATVVPTDTVESSQTPTDEPTETLAPTEAPTDMPTNTVVPSETATDEPTATVVPTDTVEPSQTPTDEPTVTLAPEETATEVSVRVDVPTATSTDTVEPSHTPTDEPTATVEPSATTEPTETLTPSPEPADTVAPSETPTDEPTAVVEPSETPTEEPTATETLTPTASATLEVTDEVAAVVDVSPSATVEPSPTPTDEPTVTPTAEATAEPIAAQNTGTSESETDSVGLPIRPEAIIGVIVLLVVLGYVGLYLQGVAAVNRYNRGFVVERCPVCMRGQLTVETRQERVFGIPRAKRVVRCNECRSVLREVGTRKWRYAVDPIENPNVYARYNGSELGDSRLKQLDSEPLPPPKFVEPRTLPKFVEDDDNE